MLKWFKQIDGTLLLKVSIILGIVFVGLGYILNDELIATLRQNLGLGNSRVAGILLNLPVLTNPGSDNTPDSVNLQNAPDYCKYVSKNDTILASDSGFLTLITKNIGFAEIPVYSDLVYLRDRGIATYQFTRLRQEPATYLAKMFADMHNVGLQPFVSSGYRTESDQIKNLNTWNSIVGVALGNQYAAEPGFSEHHLGTSVDILTHENNLGLLPGYDTTRVFKWLSTNAYRYGFVMSYPAGSEQITGYTYEPWHYRYVGIAIATQIYEQHLVLQEYLYQLNNYCLVE